MATVRLDVKTEATLRRLTTRRGLTQSEVIRDAITRLADEEGEQLSAYQRMQAFVGVFDSGGKQLSEDTGKRLRELLELADHSVLPMGFSHELVIPDNGVALDLPDGVEHMLQVELGPAHRGTASERTRSRR